MAGFTALTESHGDETAADYATELESIARELLGTDDALVKGMGDAVLLTAPDPSAAVVLVHSIFQRCAGIQAFPLLRAGIHHGPAVQRGADWFGSTVNITARVAAEAVASEVLVTDAVTSAAGWLGIPLHDRGQVVFKNL